MKTKLQFQCLNGRGEKIFLYHQQGRQYPTPVIEVKPGLYQIVRPLRAGQNERVFIPIMPDFIGQK